MPTVPGPMMTVDFATGYCGGKNWTVRFCDDRGK